MYTMTRAGKTIVNDIHAIDIGRWLAGNKQNIVALVLAGYGKIH